MNNAQALPSADAHNSNRAIDEHAPDSETIAAQNTLEHGVRSTNPVIEGRESLEDWLSHRETIVRELCPVGALETDYAGRAASYMWRLDRVIRYEITASMGQIEDRSTPHSEDSPAVPEFHALPASPMIQTIIKFEGHLQRCLACTMAELRRLQKERRQGLREITEESAVRHTDYTREAPAPDDFSNEARETIEKANRDVDLEGSPADTTPRPSEQEIPANEPLNGKANLQVSRLKDVDQESDARRLASTFINPKTYTTMKQPYREILAPDEPRNGDDSAVPLGFVRSDPIALESLLHQKE